MARARSKTTPATPAAPDAASWVLDKLRVLDGALAETLPRVHGSMDEEALHDMRVAVRKMRVLMRIARPIFGRFHADAVRAPFTDVHRATSALRDEEVLEGTLEKLPITDGAWADYKKHRKARERALRREALERLERGEVEHARALLAALLALPVNPKRRGQLGVFARECVERARREVERLRDTPPGDVEGLHALRIAYKNLRYAIEMFAPVLPVDVAAMGEPAKRFQQRLGDLHDLDVALEVVARSKLAVTTRNKVLRALRTERASQARRYLEEASPTIPPPPPAPRPSIAPTAQASTPTNGAAAAPTNGAPRAVPKPRAAKATGAKATAAKAAPKRPKRRPKRVIWRGTLSRP